MKLLPSGEPVQLTHDAKDKMSPAFSPDGGRIAYTVRNNFTGWDSWVVPVLGGEPKPFLPNASGLVWTAPGKLLFSEVSRGIHMKIVAATESRSESRDIYVPPHQRGMAHRSWLSPDGKWLLLSEMDNAGWLPCRLVPAAGGSLGRQVGPGGRCLFAAWSPDGRTMYFSAEARNGSQIWRQSFPDGEPVQLTQGPSEAAGIAMAPDGKSLLSAIGIEQSAIWLSVDGQERQVTHQGFASPPAFGAGVPRSVFSPDGKKLFYLLKGGVGRGFGTGGELWSVDLVSGATENVLPGVSVTSYDISQTGKHIVFSAIDPEFRSRIWIAPLDRGEPPRRLTDRDSTGPTFAAAGQIYYKADDGGQNYLFKQSLDAGTPEMKVWPEPNITAPNASPDGKWVSAVFQLSGDGKQTGVLAIPTGGGDPVPICKGCLTRWFLDGKAILIENMGIDTESRGVIVPLAPGQMLPKLPIEGLADLESFASLPGSKRILKLFPIPGPNASTFLFVKRTVQRNLYRIPLE